MDAYALCVNVCWDLHVYSISLAFDMYCMYFFKLWSILGLPSWHGQNNHLILCNNHYITFICLTFLQILKLCLFAGLGQIEWKNLNVAWKSRKLVQTSKVIKHQSDVTIVESNLLRYHGGGGSFKIPHLWKRLETTHGVTWRRWWAGFVFFLLIRMYYVRHSLRHTFSIRPTADMF